MSRRIARLPNEIPEDEWIKLKPHFLSFMHLFILTFFLIIWGIGLYWLFNESAEWADFEDTLNDYVGSDSPIGVAGKAGGATALWFVGLILVGFVASHLWVEKGGFKFLGVFLFIGLIGIGVISYMAKTDKDALVDFYKWFLPAYTVGMGAAGTFGIDYYRRGFRYTLTNLRIVMAKKFITLNERIVRYNHIEDVQVNQSVIGRMFGYGNVIPLTGSGIATGTDESIALAGVGKEVKGIDMGIAGGSKKTVRKAKPSPGDVLFGVKNPIKIRTIISKYIQENTGVSVMKRQEHTMERIEELLAAQSKGTIPGDDEGL
ncbi:MAG: PH domain-containing protein [Thermoplasmata archaeon]|nr:PH domain-containing protein [Thermoplasmata archaeon]